MNEISLITIGKIVDELNTIKEYNNKLLVLAKQSYFTRKIDLYRYEHLNNILNCSNLSVDEIKVKLEDLIGDYAKKDLKVEVRA